MDKTTQDSLAKKPVDMRDRILEHLEALTSAVSLDDLVRLSTSDIAETLIISRSLASQYLNDLVRAGLVVKVAGRPVRYFHRRAFQKRFQVKLSASEYASLADLIQATGIADHRDFARAVVRPEPQLRCRAVQGCGSVPSVWPTHPLERRRGCR